MSSAIMYGGSMPPIQGQVFQPAFVYRTIREAAASVCDVQPDSLLSPTRDVEKLVSALALYVALDGYGMPLSTMAFVSSRAISSVFKNRDRARKLVASDNHALQYALEISNEVARRLGVRPADLTLRPAADTPIPIADRRAGYRAPARFNQPKLEERPCMCCRKSFYSESKFLRLCPPCRTKDVSPWE